jgi:uncharacterized protein (DUF433 family)
VGTTTDIGRLIDHSPEIRSGRPRLAGTGVTVRRVAAWYRLSLNAEEIAARIGHLRLGRVYAALAYYHENGEEIEQDLATEEQLSEELARRYSRGVDRRI